MAKQLSDADWVKLAASTDQARPILGAMHVTAQYAEATDSYRLHRTTARTGLAEGLWDVKDGTETPGQYPHTDHVVPAFRATHEVTDLDEFCAVVAAAVAYGKSKGNTPPATLSFECEDGTTVAVNARYVFDALRGLPANPYVTTGVSIMAPSHLQPVSFDLGFGRSALLMPIRNGQHSARFDVSTLMERHKITAAA